MHIHMNGSNLKFHQKDAAEVKVAVLADSQRQGQLFSQRQSDLVFGLATLASACSLYLLMH